MYFYTVILHYLSNTIKIWKELGIENVWVWVVAELQLLELRQLFLASLK